VNDRRPQQQQQQQGSGGGGGGGIICRRLPVLGQPQRGRVGGLNRNSASRRRPLTPTKAVKQRRRPIFIFTKKNVFKKFNPLC